MQSFDMVHLEQSGVPYAIAWFASATVTRRKAITVQV
jgi:hypothetical protein